MMTSVRERNNRNRLSSTMLIYDQLTKTGLSNHKVASLGVAASGANRVFSVPPPVPAVHVAPPPPPTHVLPQQPALQNCVDANSLLVLLAAAAASSSSSSMSSPPDSASSTPLSPLSSTGGGDGPPFVGLALSRRPLDRSASDPIPPSVVALLEQTALGTAAGGFVGSGGAAAFCRYKTELCRPFEENGSCKYADKCQFAHGRAELRPIVRHPKYKTDLCRTYHTTGLCPYGPRCHFIHNDEERRLNELNRMMIDQQHKATFLHAAAAAAQQQNEMLTAALLSQHQIHSAAATNQQTAAVASQQPQQHQVEQFAATLHRSLSLGSGNNNTTSSRIVTTSGRSAGSSRTTVPSLLSEAAAVRLGCGPGSVDSASSPSPSPTSSMNTNSPSSSPSSSSDGESFYRPQISSGQDDNVGRGSSYNGTRKLYSIPAVDDSSNSSSSSRPSSASRAMQQQQPPPNLSSDAAITLALLARRLRDSGSTTKPTQQLTLPTSTGQMSEDDAMHAVARLLQSANNKATSAMLNSGGRTSCVSAVEGGGGLMADRLVCWSKLSNGERNSVL